MDTSNAIRTRRSIRKYKPDPVPLEMIKKIVEAGQWAPTGGNRQYWKFISVNDPKIMKMIIRSSPMVWGDAPAAIFVCKDTGRRHLSEHIRNTDYGECCGYPAQNIMLQAHAIGLGTCAIGGFNKEVAIDILDIPEDMWPMILITLGYPDEEPKAKPRRPFSEVAYLNSCKNRWQ
jgi:nitroreductase